MTAAPRRVSASSTALYATDVVCVNQLTARRAPLQHCTISECTQLMNVTDSTTDRRTSNNTPDCIARIARMQDGDAVAASGIFI